MSDPVFSLQTARALALHAQGLTTPNGHEPAPTPDVIYNLILQLGAVQIDTLQMVRRSHYVTLWSRLGPYDLADFERLAYDPDQRRLYEYWHHAACLIPLDNYRYSTAKMQQIKDSDNWRRDWLKQPENQDVIAEVRQRITGEGALRTSDFKDTRDSRGSWWDWKPAKNALEYLYDRGELMIATRVNFQRVYDLAERVLPDWVDTTPVTMDEARRWKVTQAARAAGIATRAQIAEFAFLKRGDAYPLVDALLADGTLFEVQAQDVAGAAQTMLVHRDHRDTLQQAADGAITPARTTFLNPFDSLWWTKGRDELLFGFRQRLEAYYPAKKRVWGYYCLPILHHDRLIGRFDPKLERKDGTLRLKALYLEPGIDPDDALIADVAAALRDFAAWHDAKNIVIERSDPDEFGQKLAAAL